MAGRSTKAFFWCQRTLKNNDPAAYRTIPEETAACSFAAALDPLVEQLGRISVVRGMEPAEFADDLHAARHRWDRDGPWRLVFVLQGTNPESARDLLMRRLHVRNVRTAHHASESHSVALVVNQKAYDEHRGLRLDYSG